MDLYKSIVNDADLQFTSGNLCFKRVNYNKLSIIKYNL